MNTLQLLSELEAAATPGEWVYLPEHRGIESKEAESEKAICVHFWEHYRTSNFELIAEMRNALPKLLAVVEAASDINEMYLNEDNGQHYGFDLWREVRQELATALAALEDK